MRDTVDEFYSTCKPEDGLADPRPELARMGVVQNYPADQYAAPPEDAPPDVMSDYRFTRSNRHIVFLSVPMVDRDPPDDTETTHVSQRRLFCELRDCLAALDELPNAALTGGEAVPFRHWFCCFRVGVSSSRGPGAGA